MTGPSPLRRLGPLLAMAGLMAASTSHAILCGETVRRRLERPGERVLTFDARQGEVVSITVAGTSLLGGLPLIPRWTLFDPLELPVQTSDRFLSCGGQCESQPLPLNGTYKIVVLGDLGAFNLTLEAVSDTANGLPNGPPTPTCARRSNGQPDGTQVITRGATLEASVRVEGDTDTFTFLADEAEVLTIAVAPESEEDGDGFDPHWELFDPDGQRVPTSNGARICPRTCTTRALPASGTYTIKVAEMGHDDRGEYTIALGPVSPGTTTSTTNTTTTTEDAGTTTSTTDTTPTSIPETTTTLPETTTTTIDVTTTSTTETTTSTTETTTSTTETTTSTTETTTSTIATTTSTTETTTSTTETTTSTTGTTTSTIATTTTTTTVSTTTTTTTTSTTTSTTTTTPSTTTTTTSTSSTTSSTETPTTTSPTTTTTSTTTTSTTTTTVTTSTELPTSTTTTTVTSSTAPPSTTTTTSTAPPASSTTTTLAEPQPGYELTRTLRRPPTLSSVPEGLGGALAASGGRLVIGAPHDATGAPDAGAAYALELNGPSLPAVLLGTLLKPGTPTAGDAFGEAVAVAGAGVLVGAPGDDTAAADAGAAYLFGTPTDPAPRTLHAPEPQAGEAFGAAVAAFGSDVLVGAPGSSVDGVTRAGKAFLLSGADGAPLLTFEKPDGVQSNDQLGASLAAAGNNVLIGAPGDAARAGEAFLFEGGTGRVLLRLQSPLPEVGDQFGLTVAVVGDKLAVGAPGSAMGAGKVLLFDATTGAHARTLAKQTPLPGDRFGASLAVTGGGLLIGAPGDGARVTAGGAAYLFDPDSGALLQTLRKAEPEAGDLFGTAVAATAGQVIVGSLRDDVGIVDGGAAYLYAGGVIEAVFRKRLPLAAFGSSLAVAGGDLLVGAPRDAGGKGAVHRFDATSGEARASAESPVPGEPRFGFAVAALGAETLGAAPFQDGPEGAEVGSVHGFEGSTFRRTFANPSPVAGDQFGFSLLGLGTEFLVGAPLAGERDTGAVYLFDGTSGRRRVTFQKPAPVTGDFFGAAVAGDADAILVGAPFDSTAALNAGAAYIFSRASAELDKAFFAPQPAAGDLFGSSLVLAGSRILVGAPLADAAVPDTGRVYLFDRTTGGVLATLENPTPDPGDEFGAALVLAGNNVLIGAPRDDAGALDSGAAYLFEVATGTLLQTFRNPAQGDFDQFGFAVAATRTGFFVSAPGPSRVYMFEAAAAAASLRSIAIAPRGVVGPDERCGNGLVEGAEECDDGNGVDTDDCRTDCRSPICCTIDPLAARRCDDGNPCTDDVLDAQRGCTHVENDRCCSADEDCASGKCRVCIGCFLYPWDCCDTGSTCLARTDECSGTQCLAGAFCACSGGLSCNGEAVPATVDQLFSGACDQVRLEETFAPEFTPGGQAAFRVAKGRARTARKMTRKAAKLTRRLAARGELSKSCRNAVLGRLKTVKRAIPRNRRLRRCLRAG